MSRFRSGAVLTALTAALLACGGSAPPDQVLVENRPEEWAVALTEGPYLPNLHKVSDELFRGAQPEEAGFAELKNLGVKTVVNLRTFHSDRDECRDAGLEYVHIRVQAWEGEDDEVVEFLEVVSNPGNQPVFVHCLHGADRTGVMSAAYRIVVQGWSKDEAIREMTEGGFGFHGVWQNLIDYVEELDVEGIRAELSAPEGDIQGDAVLVAAGVGIGSRSEVSPDLAEAPGPEGERWTNSIGMDFVLIPSGSFGMGSGAEDAENHEKPLHTVTISRPFYLAATEVTQAQWEAVTGGNPSAFDGANLPVEQVSWFEGKDFLRKLNARETTDRYRLPTEAEWEYACRAGTTGPWYGEPDAVAWFDPNSGGRPHPVRRKQANAWGLHDMLGNVYEWCEDWKGSYPGGSVTDPKGPSDGPGRVVRGGSWLVHENRTRSYFRDHLTPDSRRSDVGLRIVAVPPVP